MINVMIAPSFLSLIPSTSGGVPQRPVRYVEKL
jgi:hypothetical protein